MLKASLRPHHPAASPAESSSTPPEQDLLLATTGLVLQALRLRRDPAWQAQARWLLPWALACFAAVWVLALWRDLPRGLAQKAVIAMIVGWLGTTAVLLLGRTRSARSLPL